MGQVIRLSREAAELEPFRQLKATNVTRWSGLFICEGDKLVRRLLASRYATLALVCAERLVERYAPLAPPRTPVYALPETELHQLVGFRFHHGVLASGRRDAGPRLSEVCGRADQRLGLVVCPDVQDPENLGSILRTSAAFGVDAVLLGPQAADPFSRRVLRCSMGAALELPLVAPPGPGLEEELRMLAAQGVEVIATVLDPTARPLEECHRPWKWAVMFGSEGHGLAEGWMNLATERWTVRVSSRVDSLNVGVAAGIFLHHLAGGHPRGPDRA